MKKEAEEDVRRIYHDLQNHLKVLAEMKEKRLDGLEEYVEDIQNHVQPFAKYHNSGNDAIDMILFEKKQLAQEMGLEIQVQVEEDCMENLNTFQLCTLFGNAMDNAIEAASRCTEIGHDIQVKECRTPVGLSMLFQNPIDPYDIWNAKRLKTWIWHG